MLTEIRLSGQLGKRFGTRHKFDIATPGEAVRALCCMIPGFEKYMMDSAAQNVHFACFNGKENIGLQELSLPVKRFVRIVPVPAGTKNGGLMQIIIGAAIIVASVYSGGAAAGAAQAGAASGAAAGGAAAGGIAWSSIGFSLGVSMVLGGVTQMLTPQPKGLATADAPNNGASYQFNGPVNTTRQGAPVPVLYGEMYCGSAVVSAGIYAEDQA